jgi:mRNA-degrading endonuclease YafQ of YafQ-DinJ toxin-antitoxin module
MLLQPYAILCKSQKNETVGSHPKIHASIPQVNADLWQRIEETLRQMETDIFAPNLGTHKLSGKFYGLQSCSCGYDCRVVFFIEQNMEMNSEVIVLLDIGMHDEVY